MKLVTIRQFAEMQGYPEHMIRCLVRDRKIPSLAVGRRFYLNVEMAEEAIKNLLETGECCKSWPGTVNVFEGRKEK